MGLRFVTSRVLVGAAFFSCGSDRPPYLADPVVVAHGQEDAGSIKLDSGVPTCLLGPEEGVCACTETPLLGDPPTMYFVLDRSGSMNDANKWSTIRSVVASVVSKLGPRIAVGAAVFPLGDEPTCNPGGEVFSVRRGEASSALLSHTAEQMLYAIPTTAAGGTPTAATLAALAPKLKSLPGHAFVILATDGGPNCDPSAVCDSSGCIPNIEGNTGCSPSGVSCCVADNYGPASCLDTNATVASITSLAFGHVPVYVIGVPGSGPYAGVLDQMATAGGTPRPTEPKYYPVDSTDTAAFEATISKVAANITATCSLALASAPADPTLVNVYLDGVVLPSDPKNGWSLSGSTVNLVGAACAQVLSGDVLSVRIVEGCPTVAPN